MSGAVREWALPLLAVLVLVLGAIAGLAAPSPSGESPESTPDAWRERLSGAFGSLIPRSPVDPCAEPRSTPCCVAPGRASIEGTCELDIGECDGVCARKLLLRTDAPSNPAPSVVAALRPRPPEGVSLDDTEPVTLEWTRKGKGWVIERDLGPQAAGLVLSCASRCIVEFMSEDDS